MMSLGRLVGKARARLLWSIMRGVRRFPIYPLLYKSWWHIYLRGNRQDCAGVKQYLTAIPNRGAGIGHQIANWIAGFWYAKYFNCYFAHSAFSSDSWDAFLNFGYGEPLCETLIRSEGYRKIVLPWFNENDEMEMKRIAKIISSYKGERVIFVLEQDQGYRDQFGVRSEICKKFYLAHSAELKMQTSQLNVFRIAVHVRRGDIVTAKSNKNANLNMRFQDIGYFENVLRKSIECIGAGKIKIDVFSQGDACEFKSFEKFGNVEFCMDMGAQESFLRMVSADLLITSKSSFSYKPALLSKGVKICPSDFWHGYPKSVDWVLADDDGVFESSALLKAVSEYRRETC